ncbi:MAG: PAS domain S-box protein [Candidatus Lokiarchaeota archaeon]|nr:PAS domain S-box protein [Candidatus Lokiarchaeota archaeon]MBD3199985.1 PAS domain S-box protein [Candidatus Lokiarchaeota archaeon]
MQKQDKKLSKNKNKHFKELFYQSPLSILIFDKKGRIIDCNLATEQLLSFKKSELINKDCIEIPLLSLDDLNRIQNVIIDLKNGKQPDEIECQVSKKNGEKIWININISKLDLPETPLFQVILRDISERKKIEQELTNEKYVLKSIIDLNPYAIEIKDPDGYHVSANKAFIDLWGGIPPPDNSLLEDNHTESEKKAFQDAANGSVVKYKESCFNPHKINPNAHDKNIWVNCSLFPLFDREGKVENIVIMYEDITERKLTEQKLEKSQQDLMELNKWLEKKVKERTKACERSQQKHREAYTRIKFYKDLFTHDISNIMQTIGSSVELSEIYDKTDLEKQNEISQIIKNQIIRGKKLILNVQKLSQIENSGLIFERVSVKEKLDYAIDFIRESFQKKKIYLTSNLKVNNIFVKGNDLIIDVFENILLNAVRHNNSEVVEISILVSRKRTIDKIFTRIEFVDNGIGVRDSRKKQIFERNDDDSHKGKGMGLGLSLVAKIIDLFGGEIWVEDRVNGDYTKGSKFILMIPSAD